MTIVLILARRAAVTSPRALEGRWNAHSRHHDHPGAGPIARVTVSDAGQIRPLAIFADTFAKTSPDPIAVSRA